VPWPLPFEGEACECSVRKERVEYIESKKEFRKRRRNAYIAYLEQQVKKNGDSEESALLLKQAKELLYSSIEIKCEPRDMSEGNEPKATKSSDWHMAARTRRGRGKIAEYPQ